MNRIGFWISIYWVFLCYLLQNIECTKKQECFVDETQPKDDPNNIYHCPVDSKCCHEQGLPSCCKPKPTNVATMEQVQLWATLAIVIFIIALVMFCCRNDGDHCCNRKDGGRYKYFCCGEILYREGREPAYIQETYGDDDSISYNKETDDGYENLGYNRTDENYIGENQGNDDNDE